MNPLRTFLIWLYCCAGFLLQLYAFFPGFMSPDSLDQYGQALTGVYDDWHPPAMALFWRLLMTIHLGPESMLVVQLLLWLDCVGLLLRLSADWLPFLLFALLPWMPFVRNFSGYLIKDVQMCYAFLLAFVLLLYPKDRAKIFTGILAAVCILYGTSVRVNAWPAALPLAWFWCRQYLDSGLRIPFRKGAGIAILVSLVLYTAVSLPQKVLQPLRRYPEHKLFLHDLAGIYVRTGDASVFPNILLDQAGFDTAYIRKNYNPATFDNLWWNTAGRHISPQRPELQAAAIRQAWIKGVSHHPLLYLQQRSRGFLYYLRILDRGGGFCYNYPWISPNRFGFEMKPKELTRLLVPDNIVPGQRLPFYYLPWFWMLVNLLLLFAIRMIRDLQLPRSCRVLLYSSLLYQLPAFFLFQTDTDFRYFYWNCIACSLAFIFWLCSVLPGSRGPFRFGTISSSADRI